MWPTILLASVIGVVFVAIVAKAIVDKKRGKHSCSCGCGTCPMSASCHATSSTVDATPSDEKNQSKNP